MTTLAARLRRPLWAWLLLSLTGYSLLAFWFPLLPHYNQMPLRDIRAFTPSLPAGLAYAALLLALFLLYGMATRQTPPSSPVTLLALTILLALPLLVTYPINATDLYRYVLRGRVSSVHGQNPFTTPPSAVPDDPFLPLAGEWAGESSPYGPLWELIAAGLAALGRSSLLVSLLSFKGVGLAAHLGITAVLWRLSPTHNHRAARLWAWNPALLLTFVANGHNDALMLVWLLLGWGVMQRERPLFGFWIMLLAPLTKPIGLLPLPLFWLAALRGLSTWRERGRFAVLGGGGGLLLAILVFLPFGAPLALGERLLREAANVGGFSPAALLVLLGQRWDIPLPTSLVTNGGVILLGIVAVWLAWRVWRNGRSSRRSAADIFLAYLLTAFSFRIWYTSWPLPWLLLDEAAWRRRLGIFLVAAAQFSVLIYGHLRVYLLGGDHTAAHLIGVPFTLLLPFLLARRFPAAGSR